MPKKIILIASILLMAVIIFLFVNILEIKNPEQIQVCFKNNCFYVELAQTTLQRSQGLMNREYLDQNRGMLFIFKNENIYPFWMKNTLIPLDIIWINKNKEVVFIKKNAQPCSENICYNIQPDKFALYVLEVNAGAAEKINLSIGDKITFKNIAN